MKGNHEATKAQGVTKRFATETPRHGGAPYAGSAVAAKRRRSRTRGDARTAVGLIMRLAHRPDPAVLVRLQSRPTRRTGARALQPRCISDPCVPLYSGERRLAICLRCFLRVSASLWFDSADSIAV